MTNPLPHDLETRLTELVEQGDATELESYLDSLDATDVARVLDRVDHETRSQVLTLLSPDAAAEVIEEISGAQASEIVGELEPDSAAAIVAEMHPDEGADLIGALVEDEAEAILAEMEPASASEVRRLASYPDDVAGGLMITELASVRTTATLAEVIEILRSSAFAGYDIQYLYAVDAAGRLKGVLPLRDLITGDPARPVAETMIAEPVSVPDHASLDDLETLFARYEFLGVPVVDDRGRLVGVVRRHDVEEAFTEQSEEDFRRTQGIVGGEGIRSMPVWRRSSRRLSWLTINIALNLVAASVIAFYQETLVSVIALAVFLPVISDMSGCSGNQAMAVSMRELSLGLVSPRETLRVWMKEVSVGLINGIALGILLGATAAIWKGSVYLGLVVGGAMALNTVVAVTIGGTVPLMLKRAGVDPALASGPLLTTVTDMCGFFLVLSIATTFLSRLA